MSGLTGNKDMDLKILMELDDEELAIICRIDKKMYSLCEEPIFWFNRIGKVYDIPFNEVNEVVDFLEFETYKELYYYFRNSNIPKIRISIFRKAKYLDPSVEELSIGTFSKFKAYNDVLNNVILPEYIDKSKFIKHFKRKLFEISSNIVECSDILGFYQYEIGQTIANIFDKAEWRHQNSLLNINS